MTYTQPYKTKQFFFVLIKISIVVAAFYFIYRKLTTNSEFEYATFVNFLNKNQVFSLKTIFFLMSLSFFNWFFEILKWHKLVSATRKISFKNALEQSLGALTASLFTPNRIGEYGAKAIYYPKEFRKRILLINLLSNMLQMSVTLILGLIGFYFFITEFKVDLLYSKLVHWLLIIFILIALVGFVISKTTFTVKGFSFEKLKAFILNYPKQIIAFGFICALFRYVIFSFQFYYLLTIFAIDISYLEAMMVISTMYFLASIIPSIFIFDVVIKGSIAVYLFTFIGVNTLTILSIVTLMWLFNFVLPSVFGSYYVLSFKFQKDTVPS
jgi:hypothetical protein